MDMNRGKSAGGLVSLIILPYLTSLNRKNAGARGAPMSVQFLHDSALKYSSGHERSAENSKVKTSYLLVQEKGNT